MSLSCWTCLPGHRRDTLALLNAQDCSAFVFPEVKLGTGLQRGRKTSPSLPGHSFLAWTWGGKIGDAWSASGKGPRCWPGFLVAGFESKGGGRAAGSTWAVLWAPAARSLVFITLVLKKKVFNQQESVKQALWCNNSACFVINIPRQREGYFIRLSK